MSELPQIKGFCKDCEYFGEAELAGKCRLSGNTTLAKDYCSDFEEIIQDEELQPEPAPQITSEQLVKFLRQLEANQLALNDAVQQNAKAIGDLKFRTPYPEEGILKPLKPE